MTENAIEKIINYIATGEAVKLSPAKEVEQRLHMQLDPGERKTQAAAAEILYEDMTSYSMLELIREGKLPLKAVPLYFQKLRDEELDKATGAMYKRIGFSHPDKRIKRKFEEIATEQHAKILAEKYNDPQKIAHEVAEIEAKYNRLMNNRQEQAHHFANEAIELSLYPHWKTAEETTRANMWAANLYGMASQLAREVVVEQVTTREGKTIAVREPERQPVV